MTTLTLIPAVVQTLFNYVAGVALLGMTQRFWPLNSIIMALIPQTMRDAEAGHTEWTVKKLRERLAKSEARPDLFVAAQFPQNSHR
jgi:hypothetical protein